MMYCMSMCQPGPHALLYIYVPARYTCLTPCFFPFGAEYSSHNWNTTRDFLGVLGGPFWKYTRILFTIGSRLNGKTTQKYTEDGESLIKYAVETVGAASTSLTTKTTRTAGHSIAAENCYRKQGLLPALPEHFKVRGEKTKCHGGPNKE